MSDKRQIFDLPRQFLLETATARAGDGHFEVMHNVDLSRGDIRPRAGWEVVKAPEAWSYNSGTDSDDEADGSLSYSSAAVMDGCRPLGAHMHESMQGETWVMRVVHKDSSISLASNYEDSNVLVVSSDNGKHWKLYELRGDRDDDTPYTFVDYGGFTYFTNGDRVWRWSVLSGPFEVNNTQPVDNQFHTEPTWSPLSTLNDQSDKIHKGYDFYRPPKDAQNSVYLLSAPPAKVMATYNGRMFYAGFSRDRWVGVDSPVDVNGDGQFTTEDFVQDGLYFRDEDNSILLQPNYIMWSEWGLPRCVRAVSVAALWDKLPVTGMQAFNGRLAVFTERSMWVIDGVARNPMKLSSTVGCVSQRTIVDNGEGLLVWLGADGIYAWDGRSGPQKVTPGLDPLFRSDIDTTLPGTLPDVTGFDADGIGQPACVEVGSLRYASAAAWRSRGTYVCAVPSSSGVEKNDLQLCWSWRHNSTWTWSSQRGSQDDSPDTGYWPDFVTPGANTASTYTLMSSARDPETLWCQGGALTNPKATPGVYVESLCSLTGELDEFITADRLEARGDGLSIPISLLVVTSRVGMHASDDQTWRSVRLRCRPGRRHDWDDSQLSSANQMRFFFLPWQGGYDRQTSEASLLAYNEDSRTVELWPFEFNDSTQVWAYTGMVWLSGAGGSNEPRWAVTEPFDHEIEFQSGTTKHARFALYQKLEAGETWRILSMGLEVRPQRGVRR